MLRRWISGHSIRYISPVRDLEEETVIRIPVDLKRRALDQADQTERELSDLVRQGLELLVPPTPPLSTISRSDDPIFADDWTPTPDELEALGDDGVSWVAERHDRYLYDET